MAKSRIVLALSTGILLFAAFVFFVVRRAQGPINSGTYFSFLAPRPSNAPPARSDAAKNAAVGETYRDAAFGFLFQYPSGHRLATTTFGDGGEIITVEKDANTGFQIAVTPFDESDPLTAERIRLDLPDMVMDEPQAIQVGGAADVPGVAFFGDNAEFGKTREVWFAFAGNLYQVTAYATMDEEIAEVMDSWQFLQ